MNIDIITPDKKLFSGEISAVQFPGTNGSFGILNNHAPLIATLKNGEIKITDLNKQEKSFAVNGGVVEVLNNNIIVLAD
jgi:F-type H+-transporting ATPase subunit epsilon